MKKILINTASIVFLIVMCVTANMADVMEPAWKWFWCIFDMIGLIAVFIYYGYIDETSSFYYKNVNEEE